MPVALVRDVILRDGTTVRLRSPTPADESDLTAFFDGLDEESRYLRFHGAGGRMDVVARAYAEADGQARVALIAHHGPEIVAVAGYDQLRDPAAAEVAFVIVAPFQRRGLGTRMLEQLAEHAAALGLERFQADVMAVNSQMLGVFHDAGFAVRGERAGDEVRMVLDIHPSERWALWMRCRVARPACASAHRLCRRGVRSSPALRRCTCSLSGKTRSLVPRRDRICRRAALLSAGRRKFVLDRRRSYVAYVEVERRVAAQQPRDRLE